MSIVQRIPRGVVWPDTPSAQERQRAYRDTARGLGLVREENFLLRVLAGLSSQRLRRRREVQP